MMNDLIRDKFRLVKIAVTAVLITVVLLFGMNFYDSINVKFVVCNVVDKFELLKNTFAEFKSSHKDFRKLNSAHIEDTWDKLKVKSPLEKIKAISAIRIWSTNKDNVQVLMCLDSKELKIPEGSKFGILYDGIYNESKLSWKCGFIADKVTNHNIQDLIDLVPQECSHHIPDDFLTCN